jgi:DNA repair protein RecO (recombination protein O)
VNASAAATTAVLLRSVAYGEADRVVTLLTERHGQVSAIARSARRSQKRFGAALEPFALIEVELSTGTGALGRLESARLVQGFPGLLGSLERMQTAGRALDRVRALVSEGVPVPGLIDTVGRLFRALDAPCGASLALCFDLRALALSGLSPRLDACGRCGRPAGVRAALFDPEVGAVVCRACGGGRLLLAASTRVRMLGAQQDRWEALAEGFAPQEHEEAEAVLEAFHARHVGPRGMGFRTEPGGPGGSKGAER